MIAFPLQFTLKRNECSRWTGIRSRTVRAHDDDISVLWHLPLDRIPVDVVVPPPGRPVQRNSRQHSDRGNLDLLRLPLFARFNIAAELMQFTCAVTNLNQDKRPPTTKPEASDNSRQTVVVKFQIWPLFASRMNVSSVTMLTSFA